MIFLAVLLYLLVYAGCMVVAYKLRPSSVLVTLPAAFAFSICLESVFLNLLSLFQAVNRQNIIFIHTVFIAVCTLYVFRHRGFFLTLFRRLARRMKLCLAPKSSAYILLLPLFFLVTLTAFLYVPNTYDSMTYHMARVVHWMQQGSIDYYVTNIRRQNEMGPGAEYLILFFQIISGTDRLANSVQWISFLLLPAGLYYLSRLLKINRYAIPWIILLCMTTPMALLQASSTQNDLVDTILTISILAVTSRVLFGNISRLNKGEIFLAAICLSAGFLVKPISIVVAMPFIIAGCLFQIKKLKQFLLSSRGAGAVAVSVLLCLLICGPDIGRKIENKVFSRPEVYPLLNEWDKTRLYNPVAIIAPNFPFPNWFNREVRSKRLPVELYNKNVFAPHEDFVGNPIQLFVIILLPLLAILIQPVRAVISSHKKEHLRLFGYSLLPVIAWCAFGWIVKNQGWITRLQLPLFFLLPFSMAFLFVYHSSTYLRKAAHLILVWMILFSYAYSVKIVSLNPSRPLEPRFFWGKTPSAFENYYRTFDKKKIHNNFLAVAKKQNCNKAVMLVTPDYPEYPLTWRAMQMGVTIWHGFPDTIDSQPCMMFADGVKHKYVPERGVRWLNSGDTHTLVRNLEYEFNNSSKTIVSINNWQRYVDLLPKGKGTSLSLKEDQLVIAAQNEDPFFILPELELPESMPSVLKITLFSSVKTHFKLYCLSGDNNTYSEVNVYKREIGQGKNDIFLMLYGGEIRGRMRFDPGEETGEYILQGIEIRAIEQKRLSG